MEREPTVPGLFVPGSPEELGQVIVRGLHH
jgi:hypothetical protein